VWGLILFIAPSNKQMASYKKNEQSKAGYISKSFIDRLLDDTKLEEVIQDFVALKKEGANFKGKSPFVDERTPSFVVSPVKQIWKCFSSSKGGNNAISFLMEQGKSYPEAIEYLANRQGKTIEYEDTKEAKAYQEKLVKINELRPVLKRGIATYMAEFKKLPDNHPAKHEVFNHRQYNQDIIDTYQIGFAPGNKFIYNKLKENGLVKAGEDVSLISTKQGVSNDFYYNRVTYTIFDANGEAISIAGRDLQSDTNLKWLNGKTTTLYSKEFTWYGLHIAKAEIRSTGTAYIMEGYNDVIAFQTHGIRNTVAPCGTSIHINQIRTLKKYANVAVFFMDPDKAGKTSTLKNVKRFFEVGFSVYVITGQNEDPDDFVRNQWPNIESYYTNKITEDENPKTKDGKKEIEALQNCISGKNIKPWFDAEIATVDGFKLLLDQMAEANEVEKAKKTKELCDLLSKLEDDSMIEVYKLWLKKESGVGASLINGWIKDFKQERDAETAAKYLENNEYELPKGVEMTEQILNDIKRYQMFQAKNQIFTQNSIEPPYKFKQCSNFSVFIIQHMRDENFPKKLVSAENIFKESFVFDVPSDTFNVSAAFQKAMTNFGNFRWHGRSDDLTRLQALLFDKMGNGRSLDVLGWQVEGFFLFNNLVVVPNGENIVPDKNGCFKFKGVSYYVPSANVIYKDNPYKYQPQKNFRHIPGTISELELFNKIYRVHGKHAISSIFHAIACMFHDLVAKHLKGFPINFSYGPPGTGKDELNHAVRSLWGVPQVATNLEGGNSTATASIRELAQFNNALIEWSEYARGDSKLEGTIKSLWDLRGKKTGNIESKIATDNIPILSGVALTGNEYPDQPATITRLVWNDMNRTDFTEEDEKYFNELNDDIDAGITHITVKIIKQRSMVEANFNKEYRLLMDVYQRRLPDANKRMLKNISTLTAFYNILKNVIDFPFDTNTILDHFTTVTENQMRKLTSSSIITRWWDCFLASMRGTLQDQILVGRDLKLEGSLLYFQFTNCYSKVQRQWFSQYRDAAPAKATMKEAIEKEASYFEYKKVVDFNSGSPRVQSSALVVDILKLPGELPDLIKAEVNRQEFERNVNPFTPKTPLNKENKNENDEDEVQTDLPF